MSTTAATNRHGTVQAAVITLIIATAAAFIAIPAWQLLGPGPFSWHVKQPAFWQGGIEALVLVAALAGGLALGRRSALIGLVAVPAALYLRRHAVDAGVLVDMMQLEITIGLGMTLRRALRLPPARAAFDYVQAFIAGFALWSVCAWTLQALDLGSLRAMAWLAVVLAVVALGGGHRPVFLFLWQRVREGAPVERAWCGALAAWMLVLFAHSRTAIGFDVQWYSLRSPFVLVPGNSVYESLGLTSPVYYYPKIYEVFSLPLYVLKDHVAINGFSIVLLLPLLLCCGELMRRWQTPPRARLPLLALVATLPALANAASAKPDVLCTLLVLAAAVFGFDAVQRRSAAALAWQMACIALACSAKITAIPYAGIVLLATLAAYPWAASRAPCAAPDAPLAARLAWIVLAMSLLAALFVVARTLLLAGVPTIGPDPLLGIWHRLGWNLKPPAGTLAWTSVQDWHEVPALLIDALFRPQRLEHIVISWVGNVWLWLALVACVAAVAGRRRDASRNRARWPMRALIATGFLLAAGNRYQVPGGDGNYFLYALLPAILCAGTAAFRRLDTRACAFAAALACLPAFVAFQAAYSFASEAWTPGTRAFDLDFSQSPRGMRRLRVTMLDRAGLSRIGAFLQALPHATRVTGFVETPAQFWLPACFEDLREVSYSYPNYASDAAAVRRFLHERNIAYVIVPRADAKPSDSGADSPLAAEVATQLAALPGVRRIEDKRYDLLDLSAVDPAVSMPSSGSNTVR